MAMLGVGGSGSVGNFVCMNDGLGGKSGDGTVEFGRLVRARDGIDEGIKLSEEGDIVDGLAFSPSLFVGVGLGVGDGV